MTKVEKDNPALQIRRVIFDWKQIERWSYVRQIKALKKVNELVFHKNITFFVGENGSGKSTLLEAIAVLTYFYSSEDKGAGKTLVKYYLKYCAYN